MDMSYTNDTTLSVVGAHLLVLDTRP